MLYSLFTVILISLFQLPLHFHFLTFFVINLSTYLWPVSPVRYIDLQDLFYMNNMQSIILPKQIMSC